MKKIIIYSILLFSFQSGLVAQSKVKKKEAIESFIKTRIINLSNHNFNLRNEVILESHLKDVPLENIFTPDYFYFINKYNIKSEKDVVRFNTFFSKEEFLSMQAQIKNNPYKKWSQLIGKSYFKKQKKDSKRKFVSYSTPVFNKDYTMAIVYIAHNRSVVLSVYEKTDNDSWKHIGGALLSSSD
ncbi:MAG: hypothetical protein JXR05_07590 [Flavobacteriaceae bacterium]